MSSHIAGAGARAGAKAYVALNVLNVLDAFGTLVAVHLGASEYNPAMGSLLMGGALLFVLVKFSVVWIAASFLRVLEMERVLAGAAVVYGLVVGWELFHLARLGLGMLG